MTATTWIILCVYLYLLGGLAYAEMFANMYGEPSEKRWAYSRMYILWFILFLLGYIGHKIVKTALFMPNRDRKK